ncbi:MAG TPA: pitrilysin family protein [Paucimonas sp.]|nr:pitrilysin family protein [Paucimonas sp.]
MKARKLLVLPALLFAIYGTTTPTFAADAATTATPAAAATASAALPHIAYEKYTLPNGLDVILVEDHRLPIAAVNIWYHVGAANEEPGLTGFAHLFEHMMFAASKHIPRGMADKLLESAGVTDSNGSTDFDRTNYYDTVPSNQLELALWIHSDRMGYLLDVLDQTALSNQQDVVRNERRQSVENRPYGIVEEALFHQLFPKNHPYYASVIGSHADIQAAKLDDIKRFFMRYYRPNNASLVIAGDIDKAKTRALVAKYFGGFKRGEDVPALKVVTPPITTERRAVVHDRVELPRVFMGWLTSPAFKEGDAELSMAAQILAGGKSSRLYKKLVYEKQIAQDVSAVQYSATLTSMFIVDVTARPGHTAQEIEAAIDEELELLRTAPPTEQELERARNTIETAMITQIEKLGGSGLANQLNYYNQYLGDPGYLPQDIERYRKVSAADIQRVAAAQLKNSARAVVHGVPGQKELGPEVPTPPAKKVAPGTGTMALNADEAWRKKKPAAEPLKAVTLPKGDAFTLPNGLTVIHYHNPALPLVAAELVVKSGSAANPVDKPGLASFTAAMLEQGTKHRSALQIADEVAQLGAFLGTGSVADGSRVQVMALQRNFGRVLDLLADVALNPTFPAEEVERERSSRLGELAQMRDSAPAVANRVALAALFGGGHPYGQIDIGTEAAVKSIKPDDLHSFWKRHYVPGNAALVVSGAITRDELKVLAEAKFGGWKGGEVKAEPAAAAKPTAARLVLVDKPGAPQTALNVIAMGAERRTADYPALQVMNAALGGLFTSRINNNLREQKGYTYGVRSGFSYRRMPGPFSISGSFRTDVTGESVGEIFKEIAAMAAKPMPAKELEGARNSQILSLPGQFETNRAIGGSLSNVYLYDLGLDYYSGLAKRFAAVTAKDVQSAVKKYLQPANLIVVGVGDKAKIEPQIKKRNPKLGPIEYRDADGNILK